MSYFTYATDTTAGTNRTLSYNLQFQGSWTQHISAAADATNPFDMPSAFMEAPARVEYRGGSSSTTSITNTRFYQTASATTSTITTPNLMIDTNGLAQWSGAFSTLGRVKDALMKIFEPVPKEILKEMTDEEKKLIKAKEKSEKLLKEWLSPAEYKALLESGEIQIPSRDEEGVIFIVKKDPSKMVEVKKSGILCKRLCLVSKDLDMPVGDQLLAKVALLKTDEKQFKEIAIPHGIY